MVEEERPTLAVVTQPSQRARRIRAGFGVTAILALLGAGVFGLLQTSAFAVGSVEFAGNQVLPVEDLTQLAAVNVGEPMVSVDPQAVQRRLQANPWVASADVSQQWPDTVTIAVTERSAVAATQAKGGRWAQLADQGVVLQVDDQPAPNLPVLIGQEVDPVPGARVSVEGAELVTLIGQLPDSLRPKVVQLQRTDGGEYRLGLSSGPIVELGTKENLGDKLMAASAVLSKSDNAAMKVLDVRSPRLPVAVPVNPPTTTTVVRAEDDEVGSDDGSATNEA